MTSVHGWGPARIATAKGTGSGTGVGAAHPHGFRMHPLTPARIQDAGSGAGPRTEAIAADTGLCHGHGHGHRLGLQARVRPRHRPRPLMTATATATVKTSTTVQPQRKLSAAPGIGDSTRELLHIPEQPRRVAVHGAKLAIAFSGAGRYRGSGHFGLVER